jgi:hypothetical protein
MSRKLDCYIHRRLHPDCTIAKTSTAYNSVWVYYWSDPDNIKHVPMYSTCPIAATEVMEWLGDNATNIVKIGYYPHDKRRGYYIASLGAFDEVLESAKTWPLAICKAFHAYCKEQGE